MDYKSIFNLKGKTAIVTGGCGFLGREFCKGLATFGANVAIVDLNEKAAKALAKQIAGKYRTQTLGIACDVSDPQSIKSMVKTVVSKWKRIDILHNNAAAKSKNLKAFFQPVEKYDLKTWREIMSVNLDGMFLVAQSVGSQMAKQKSGGSIIQTASIYGVMAPDQRIYKHSFYLGRKINTPAVYSASKGGVIALTKHLATYWASREVRVNTLTPGGVESGQNKQFIKN